MSGGSYNYLGSSSVSAAEKLRALDEVATPRPWDYDWNAPQHILASDGSGKFVATIPRPNAAVVIALRNALPQIIAVVEAAEEARLFLDWAVQVEIPKHEKALTTEVREATGNDDYVATFDSPLPGLRDQVTATLAALEEVLG